MLTPNEQGVCQMSSVPDGVVGQRHNYLFILYFHLSVLTDGRCLWSTNSRTRVSHRFRTDVLRAPGVTLSVTEVPAGVNAYPSFPRRRPFRTRSAETFASSSAATTRTRSRRPATNCTIGNAAQGAKGLPAGPMRNEAMRVFPNKHHSASCFGSLNNGRGSHNLATYCGRAMKRRRASGTRPRQVNAGGTP